jgi:hypothetical protein
MKHLQDIEDKELDLLLDEISGVLAQFMSSLISHYDLCDLCAHNIIETMCEEYIENKLKEKEKDNESRLKH